MVATKKTKIITVLTTLPEHKWPFLYLYTFIYYCDEGEHVSLRDKIHMKLQEIDRDHPNIMLEFTLLAT